MELTNEQAKKLVQDVYEYTHYGRNYSTFKLRKFDQSVVDALLEIYDADRWYFEEGELNLVTEEEDE